MKLAITTDFESVVPESYSGSPAEENMSSYCDDGDDYHEPPPLPPKNPCSKCRLHSVLLSTHVGFVYCVWHNSHVDKDFDTCEEFKDWTVGR